MYKNEEREWLAVLAKLKTDNVWLKNDLSKAICRQVSLDFVARAELFQQQFIEKDLFIDLLRRDIIMLRDEISIKGMTDENRAQHMALKKAVVQLRSEFQKMKSSFNSFLGGNEFS